MNKKLIFKNMILILAVLCVTVSTYGSHASFGSWCYPKVTQYPEKAYGGPMQLRIVIGPIQDTTITQATLLISKTLRLTYTGDTEIVRAVISHTDSMVFELSLILPDNDTSGIEFWFLATPNRGESGYSRYWVTNQTKPEQFGSDPRYFSDNYYERNPPGFDYTYTKDSIDARLAKNKPSTYQGFVDDSGNPISEAEWKQHRREKFGWPADYEPPNPQAWDWVDSLGNPIPQQEWEIQKRLDFEKSTEYKMKQDTTVVWIIDSVTKQEKPVWKPWHERELKLKEHNEADSLLKGMKWVKEQEQSPLESVPFQMFTADGERFVRYRGETKFRPYNSDEFRRYMQSLPPGSIPDTGLVTSGDESKKKDPH